MGLVRKHLLQLSDQISKFQLYDHFTHTSGNTGFKSYLQINVYHILQVPLDFGHTFIYQYFMDACNVQYE